MELGENDNPTLETLRKVVKALDVPVDELINQKICFVKIVVQN